MLEKYTKELTELADWYTKTKELAIKVEGLDSKSYIQPLHELRYSYDHLMRAVIYELNSDNADGKIKKAILSAKGHLVRAYSDCIEWLLVTVKDEYNRILRPQKGTFTFDEILSVMPDYQNIRSQLQTLTDAVDAYKTNKRSEENEDFNPIEELDKSID